MNSFKKTPFILLIIFLGCSSPNKLPPIFEAKVIAVIDGDTVDVSFDDKSYRVRLADIDCPEDDQPFGDEATEFVSSECLSDSVIIETEGEWDPYGRLIATVFIQDTININLELVKKGLAWHYKEYSDDEAFSDAENKARNKHVMLWSDSNAIAPWDWRH